MANLLRTQLSRAVLLTTVILTTASCSGINPLGALTGGTNVAANTQIGRTNTQTVGTTNNTDAGIRTEGNVENINQDIASDNTVSTERVENLTVNEIPPWVVLLLLLGWLLPTPSQIAESILNLFRRRS